MSLDARPPAAFHRYLGENSLPLIVKGGLAWAQPLFGQPVFLYTSPHNPEALEVAKHLAELFVEVQEVSLQPPPRRRSPSRGGASPLRLRRRKSSQAAPSGKSNPTTHWLLFLSPTVFDGQAGEDLAMEISSALKSGIKPVMVYASEDYAFHDVIEATPRALLSAGIYGPLAIEWRDGPLRPVSMRLVVRALGARMGLTCREELWQHCTALATWLWRRCLQSCEASETAEPRGSNASMAANSDLNSSDRASVSLSNATLELSVRGAQGASARF